MSRRVSMKDELRRLFLKHKGEILTNKQLQAVVGNRTEWARRVRELRMDEGWPIQTHHDDASLKVGQYRLIDDPPEPGEYKFGPRMSQTQRARILHRNGHTCQSCGAGIGDHDDQGRPIRLHVDHHEAYSHGGRRSDENLRALCSACNQGRKNLTPSPPSWVVLLTHIRQASVGDQRKALEWLKLKFAGKS